MTLLSVVKDVCAVVGVTVPQSVFSNITGNRTMQEMLSLANEMAQRIAYDYRDWTKLRTMATFTGDGTTTAFRLPANYKRMLLTSNVWRSTSTQQPMHFVPDSDEWMQRRASNASNWAWGEWTMLGGYMHIYPVMSGLVPAWQNMAFYQIGDLARDVADQTVWRAVQAHITSATLTFAQFRVTVPTAWTSTTMLPGDLPIVTATFGYLDKNCIDLASGGRGDVFMSDADTFTLDERLLKLGMIWQWKAQKGASYAEDMGTYGDALAVAMGHDSPAPIILGRKPISASASVAYPWPVPT